MSNHDDALKAQVAANTALLRALAIHVAANNRDVYANIINDAIKIASQLDGASEGVRETAVSALLEAGNAQIKLMTPPSALGPGGFQSKVLR
jgi:hypothetical protein